MGLEQVGGTARQHEVAHEIARRSATERKLSSTLHGEGDAQLRQLRKALLAIGVAPVFRRRVRGDRGATVARWNQARWGAVQDSVEVLPGIHEALARG